MDIMLRRILELLGDKHGAAKKLADYLGVAGNTITNWKHGASKSYPKYAPQIAEYFGVSLDWLSGLSDQKEKPVPFEDEQSDFRFVRFPVIGSISAGNGCVAIEEYTGDYAFFYAEDLHAPAEEYFALRISGDSMYPKMLDGDYVLVRKTPSVDSGRIAVVIYNGDEATVKKVNYVMGEDWIELIPINPEYKARRIEGAELECFRVLGEVVKLTRDI